MNIKKAMKEKLKMKDPNKQITISNIGINNSGTISYK